MLFSASTLSALESVIIEKNLDGIQSIITKDKYGKFVLTGYEFNDTIEEARNSIEAVIATYGNTPEFLGVYAQVGAVLTSYNYNISQSENLSRINQMQEQLIELEKENNLLKEKLNVFDREIYQTTELVTNKEKDNSQAKDMENYVITQERNGEITVLASSYKNAIFVGGDYLSDYETYNLEKVNNLLKDLQESNPDNEYKIMTENDFRQTYLLEENKLSPTEYLTEKINASGINIHLSKEEMKAILEAGKDVQKLAVKYGTNQNIESENENTFNGYGTYVVSVNEENARQLGIKIASRKYGGTFYINNQPLSQFLQEKNFSSYWIKRLEQLNTNSIDNLSHEIMMANVNGNATLEQEQNKLSTILSLDLVEYKREQTYLYSVEIPDNDNTNYLLYNNPIGIDQATKINNELVKMGVEWRASRNDIGKNIYFELLSKNVFDGNQKAASEFLKENVGFVGMQMDNANYIIFNDKDMSINNRVQYMKSENGEVYGFTFDGEIYIDEDLVNSNVLAHEYTHIWDNYVQKNNPELWQKGMTCLKGTSLWYEITEDKNYENLRTDDEILSECHARIVGKMAEQVLERIAARDGELTKDKIIDWDREVSEYVATELLIKPELGDENYISESVKAEYLKEFLSMPMKDLMNEVRIQNYNQSNDIQEMRRNIEALKTPFGQNSKLNYKEWSFARSDEFKKQFGDWESKIKKDYLLSKNYAIKLTGDEFSRKEDMTLTEQVEEYFNNENNVVVSPFFGKVVLDKKGVEDSLAHGMGRLKAIAYASVKDVINKGVILDIDENHKERGYNSYVVAAPIKIKDEDYICEVVLKKNKNETRFYLHEVTEQKKFLGQAFLTNLAQKPARQQGTLQSILEKTVLVNDNILCPLTENGEPEKSFVANELKKIQKYAETIDSSQKENPEESVEKSPKDINFKNLLNINNANYIDEDLVNSNVLAHEYTHIWDNYVQKNNPELWQKGMTCLKGTSLWYEITEDKNYENLRTDDEILSECHARIVGKMAEQVLERIAARDGELTKDKIIDWDREVSEYVATELLIKPELGDENYISESVKAEYLKEFLSMPMKDLMNEVKVNELNLNKKSSKPDMQIDKTSISSESPSFPVEPQLSIGSRATHIILQNDTERQAIIKKLDKIKTEKIEPREFLIKLKEAYSFEDKDSSDYVANRINNSKFALRISNHSVNAHYVEKKYVETSIVIRLSYNEFQDEKDKYVAEFNYTPEMLTPEKKQEIVDNLKTWTLTGQYPETDIEPKYSPSEVEWKKANAKMLNCVNSHSSKIQKYAETIDNSQTENPEESVEKSSKDIKPEISVVCGEIKSILGNKFTGGNIKLSQDFQHELIEKGLVNPEEEFVLINDAEAVAQGCKIKSDQPFVFLNIPVENNGKTDFVQTKYYHVSALEEPQKLEKNVEEAGNQNEAVDKNIIIYGETKVPEFAIITQHGLKTYSNLIIESYDPTSHSYLLQSEDGSQRLNITEETYNELMSNTFQEKAQSFTDDEPAYNKLLETQYNDYFKQRDNTAYNFKHNLSVYCRKEANSPCNALEIAKGIISRMSVEEKNKTKSLLQKMANGKTLNEVIVDIYHEAIKEVPLNEEYIKIKVPEKVIARPFYDTVSNNGQLISKDYNLKIGDTLKNVNISSEKLFGKGTENIKFDELKIISSSKEGNCITLMDSNKSFIEVPLDTVLSSYEKYKSNTQKIEKRNTVSMDISY